MKVHERFGSHWSKYPTNKPDYDVDRENNNNSYLNIFKNIPPPRMLMGPQLQPPPHSEQMPLSSMAPFPHSKQQHHEYESETIDLSMNGARHREEAQRNMVIEYNSRQSPSKRMKLDTPGHDFRSGEAETETFQRSSCNTSPSADNNDQAENVSVSTATSEDGNSSVNSSPQKTSNNHLGKSPYFPSPFHMQKKTPLKNDRWTPSTPLPTVPECRQCGFTFDNFEVLSEHNEAVHSVFTCQHCHKTFTSRSNLERHARLHTGFKPYVCAICQKAFSRKDHLSNHSAKHAYKCGHCNKRYADKTNLATHFTYEHDSILTNCCEFCNKGFGNLEAYEEHVKTHPQYHAIHKSSSHAKSTTTVSPKKFACDTCKFVSQDRITLIKHRLVHLEGQRCYTCLACAKVFDDPLQYDEHLLLHQAETNIFECCICRQIFQSLDILKHHEVVHLNDDLNELMTTFLPCPHCDKVFREISSLQEHILMHNNQGKKHRCFFCNLGFNSYSELCRHMEELRHYPPDPRMIFNMALPAAYDHRKYSEISAKRNLQKDFITVKPHTPPELKTIEKDGEEINQNHNEESSVQNNTNESLKIMDEKDAVETNQNHTSEKENNDIGSDIEVVEPEAPDDSITENIPPMINESGSSYQFVVTENKSSVIEIKPEEPLNSSVGNNNSTAAAMTNGDVNIGSNNFDSSASSPNEKMPDVNEKTEDSACGDTNETKEALLKAKERSRKRKGPSPEKYVEGGEPLDMSLSEYYDNCDVESMTTTSERSSSPQPPPPSTSVFPSLLQQSCHISTATSPENVPPSGNGDASFHNRPRIVDRKPRDSSKTTLAKMSFDIPSGPHTCSVCQLTLSNFQALEQHCFAEHSRCPCMFCPKTFAQKANRDRHICLHTGDKPYTCPECGEKFSRGDKLKLHRVRTHNIPTANPATQFTLKRESSAANGGNSWSIHCPTSNHSDYEALALYRDDSNSNGSVVHGAGEWSRIPETTSTY